MFKDKEKKKIKVRSVGLKVETLNVRTLNVGTLTGKTRGLAYTMERGKVDVRCLQNSGKSSHVVEGGRAGDVEVLIGSYEDGSEQELIRGTAYVRCFE